MLRNYLAAALRNLVRNKLYAAINIIGLAIGFAAALLIGMFVRDELSYDRWIPGHEHSFLMRFDVANPGLTPRYSDVTPTRFRAALKLYFPQIQASARLYPVSAALQRGEVETNARIVWADPDFFAIVALPAVTGDPDAALHTPDGLVLTQSMARKYFGREDVIGETLVLDRQHPMTVRAVLRDIPANSHLNAEIFAAGMASFSGLSTLDAGPLTPDSVYTYLRLRSAADFPAVQAALPDFMEQQFPGVPLNANGTKVSALLLPLAGVHLSAGNAYTMKPRGDIATLYAFAAIGGLIVLVAGLNFVNLMTARATRRAVEIGVRKVSGAQLADFILQFIGEALIYAVFGLVLAAAVAAAFLPAANAFLQRTLAFDPLRAPVMALAVVAAVLGLGVLAGLYPAFVLSRFRPAAVLRGRSVEAGESVPVRQVLVILQFAILIGLILSTGVIYRQTRYAFAQALRLNADQMLLVTTDCTTAFKDAVKQLPGVRRAACSSGLALNFGEFTTIAERNDGTPLQFDRSPVDFGFFETYGLTPLAGRFFSPAHPGDMAPANSEQPFQAPLVLNATAVRDLGFASPAAAVGQTINYMARNGRIEPCQIVGVTPDFAMDAVHKAIPPAVYFVDPPQSRYLSVSLAGGDIPETLRAIDQLWKETGEARPIRRQFLDERVQELYRDISRQAAAFAVFAGVSLFIACLGLFGLAAFTAERRTKEIGIRKAMGASQTDVLRLLVWQFAKPVLWANLIAWPAGYYVMRRWLQGFAYHVDLEPWIFIAASTAAFIIAILTVVGHALLVARTQPVSALRYE